MARQWTQVRAAYNAAKQAQAAADATGTGDAAAARARAAKAKASIRSIAATAEARIAALRAEAGKLPDVNAAFAGAGW